MKISFAGSIRAGRHDAALYYEIVQQLQNYGKVFTEHVGNAELSTTLREYQRPTELAEVFDEFLLITPLRVNQRKFRAN